MTLEQDVAELMARMPRSARRDGLDGHSHPSSPLRAKVLLPKTVQAFDGSTAATGTPTATSAFVGLVTVLASITADRLTYVHNSGGATNGTVRIALYREDGQLKLLDITDAVADAAAGERTVTFDAVFLSPGNYYILACAIDANAIPAFFVYNTSTTFGTGASGEPDTEGDLTITGGAAPDTFDPTAITTPAADKTIAFRLDGQ